MKTWIITHGCDRECPLALTPYLSNYVCAALGQTEPINVLSNQKLLKQLFAISQSCSI